MIKLNVVILYKGINNVGLLNCNMRVSIKNRLLMLFKYEWKDDFMMCYY